MNPIKYRKWWYIISLIIIIPGTISLILFGLKLSVDFTGGTQIEITGTKDKAAVMEVAKTNHFENANITVTDQGLLLRAKQVKEADQKKFNTDLTKKIPKAKQTRIETVGPSISRDITLGAITSIVLASVLVVLYMAYVFRKVPKPANSWAFGITAVFGLLHDVLALLGIFSLLGHFFGIEVDPLFITAMLTVIGFSVHDTVVIYDRIRENLIKGTSEDFDEVVNRSFVEMLDRDLSTSFLVWIMVLVLYLFGGETIKHFLLALLIGIVLGTYSSICNSASLLVTWHNFREGRKVRKARV